MAWLEGWKRQWGRLGCVSDEPSFFSQDCSTVPTPWPNVLFRTAELILRGQCFHRWGSDAFVRGGSGTLLRNLWPWGEVGGGQAEVEQLGDRYRVNIPCMCSFFSWDCAVQ
jgi:hypothetical protein